MRIVGTTIPDNKKIEFSLRYIFGVGAFLAKKILRDTQIDSKKRARELTPDELNRLREVIERNYRVEGELRRDIMMHIKRHKDIKTYRGIRHMRGLPVNGQRTKTNSRTRRGNARRTMGSGRKKAANPT